MTPYAIAAALFATFVVGGILTKAVPLWLVAVIGLAIGAAVFVDRYPRLPGAGSPHLPPKLEKGLLSAAECPTRENKGYNKSIAPDPGSCTRDFCGSSRRTGTFFCSYTARCRQDATAKGR
jgi:hypothetical protein